MSSLPGDVAQSPPESKSTGGLANVFKSLTSSRSAKIPSPQSSTSSGNVQFVPQTNSINTVRNAIYGGPPNYEQLYEQLKSGKPLSDRLAAAESLRHAVVDYPLSNVSDPTQNLSNIDSFM